VRTERRWVGDVCAYLDDGSGLYVVISMGLTFTCSSSTSSALPHIVLRRQSLGDSSRRPEQSALGLVKVEIAEASHRDLLHQPGLLWRQRFVRDSSACRQDAQRSRPDDSQQPKSGADVIGGCL
jgi:hypothetical protein